MTDRKLICCILPKGVAPGVVKRLKDERGINTADVTAARGMGKLTPLAYRKATEQTEKEILSVVAAATEADSIFDFIYEAADVNRPHGGLLYMLELSRSTDYMLPADLPEES